MAIGTTLFKAILAMDAYNRGYNRGIDSLSDGIGTNIGNATVFDNKGDAEAQSASFYAIAYTLGGEKIISYRGTDDLFEPFWSDSGSDPWNGYNLGAGSPIGKQSSLALAFYEGQS